MDRSSLKPLPADIQAMSSEETACQYCGISYLLLSKYEKMTILCENIEKELSDLKQYVQERPGMLKKMDELMQLEKEFQIKESEWESKLNQMKKQSEWDQSDLALYKKRNQEMQEVIEKEKGNSIQLKSDIESEKKALNSELNQVGLNLVKMSKHVQNDSFLTQNHEKLYQDVSSTFTLSFDKCMEIHTSKLKEAEKRHVAQMSIMEKQKSDLSNQLQDLNEIYEDSLGNIKALKEELFNVQSGYKCELILLL